MNAVLTTRVPFATTHRGFLTAAARYLESGQPHMPIHEALQWATQLSDSVLELEESEELFRLWLDSTADVFIHLSSAGVVLRARAGRDDHLALGDPEKQIGRRYAEILPPDAVKLLDHAIETATETGKSQTFGWSLPKPSGTRWYDCRLIRVSDGSFILFEHDITDTRHAESRLANLIDVFAVLFDLVPTPIIQIDPESLRIEAWSRGAEEILGWSREEMVDRDLSALIPDRNQATFLEHVKRLRAGQPVHDATAQIRTKAGKTKACLLDAYPLVNRAGVVRHMIGVLRHRDTIAIPTLSHALADSLLGVSDDHR